MTSTLARHQVSSPSTRSTCASVNVGSPSGVARTCTRLTSADRDVRTNTSTLSPMPGAGSLT